MKLTINNIKILGEGQQAKRHILHKYGSIEEFARATDISNSISSITTYLKQREIANKTFKFRLVSLLNMSHDELFMSPEKQVLDYIEDVYYNIKEYHGDADLELMNYLKDKCNVYSMKTYIPIIYWCIGQCHFNSGSTHLAVEYIKEAINLSRYNIEQYVKFSSDLGLIYLLINEYEKARMYLMRAENKIVNRNTVDSDISFRLYYRLGILNNNTNEINLALEALNKAIEVAPNNYDKGKAIMNKGMSYKKQQLYDKAIEYYMLALKYFDPEDKSSQAITCNNIAEVLKVCKRYSCALRYADLSVKLCGRVNKRDKIICINTFVQIKLLLNEVDNKLYELIEITLDIDKTNVYKKFVIDAVETVVKYGKENKNKDLLVNVKDILKQILSNNEHEIEYIKDIKLSLYEIYEILYEGGVKNEKKDD